MMLAGVTKLMSSFAAVSALADDYETTRTVRKASEYWGTRTFLRGRPGGIVCQWNEPCRRQGASVVVYTPWVSQNG